MLACTKTTRVTDRPTRRPRQGGPVFLPRRKLSAFGASLLEPGAFAGPDPKRERAGAERHAEPPTERSAAEGKRAAVLGAGLER